MVHIYTGDGKGKTTAAVGLGIRALGRGLKVLMVQFLKGAPTGEAFIIDRLVPDFTLIRGKEHKKFTWSMNDKEKEELKEETLKLFEFALSEADGKGWDLIILDEIMAAVTLELVPLKDVEDFLKNLPQNLELVLTGRNAPQSLIELTDYVSEIKAVKHPFTQGVPARTGIES